VSLVDCLQLVHAFVKATGAASADAAISLAIEDVVYGALFDHTVCSTYALVIPLH
jgi:hypothetical protein